MVYKRLPLRSKLTIPERKNLTRGFALDGNYMEQIRKFVGDNNFSILGFEYRGVPYAGSIAASLSTEETISSKRFKEGVVETVYFLVDEDKGGNIEGYNLSISKDMLKPRKRFVFVDESLADYDSFGSPPNFVAARKMLKYSYATDKDSGKPVCNLRDSVFVKCSPFEVMTAEDVYVWTFERLSEDGSPRFAINQDDLGGSANGLVSKRGAELRSFVGEQRIQNGEYLVCAPAEHVIGAIGICLSLNGNNRAALCEVRDDFAGAVNKKSPAGKKVIIVGSHKDGTKSHEAYKFLVEQNQVSKDDIKFVSAF